MALLNWCMKFEFFLTKSILLKHYEDGNKKKYSYLSKGPPNPGFMQKKVQKGDFLKKTSRESIFFCCFRFLWISRRPGTLNWERVFFWLSKNLYKQCVVLWLICRHREHRELHLHESHFNKNPYFYYYFTIIYRTCLDPWDIFPFFNT